MGGFEKKMRGKFFTLVILGELAKVKIWPPSSLSVTPPGPKKRQIGFNGE
jgi:hypothetical protein